jgi:hypothetical protein
MGAPIVPRQFLEARAGAGALPELRKGAHLARSPQKGPRPPNTLSLVTPNARDALKSR